MGSYQTAAHSDHIVLDTSGTHLQPATAILQDVFGVYRGHCVWRWWNRRSRSWRRGCFHQGRREKPRTAAVQTATPWKRCSADTVSDSCDSSGHVTSEFFYPTLFFFLYHFYFGPFLSQSSQWFDLAFGVETTYIFLCDLLMDLHVSQSQTQVSTLSNNSAVSSCALLWQSGHATCVLPGKTGGGTILQNTTKKDWSFLDINADLPYVYSSSTLRHCVNQLLWPRSTAACSRGDSESLDGQDG